MPLLGRSQGDSLPGVTWEIGYRDVDEPPGQPEPIGTVEAATPNAAIEDFTREGAKAGLYGVREKGTEVWELYVLDSKGLHPAPT